MGSIVNFIKKILAKSEKSKIRDEVLSEEIDFDIVVNSSLLAKQVYDELKVLVHPDRFQDPEMVKKATEIFQLISQNKSNYEILVQLRIKAHSELSI